LIIYKIWNSTAVVNSNKLVLSSSFIAQKAAQKQKEQQNVHIKQYE